MMVGAFVCCNGVLGGTMTLDERNQCEKS
jgi:hypothetical protein